MDSLTQAVLGATTFALVKDKDIGKKSLIIGAIVGTIPDLDVLLAPFFNEIEFLTVHRSISHSIWFAVLLSLLLAYFFHQKYDRKQSFRSWFLAFFLAIFTHSLLDACTSYGTKLLSPFNGYIFSTNNIHVIEPIYTLILLGGTLWLAFKNKLNPKRSTVLKYTLILSTAYLGWTFVSKGIAIQKFSQSLEKQEIEYTHMRVSPTPFNTLLWHGIIKTNEGYYFGTYSLLDGKMEVNFHFEKSQNHLLKSHKNDRLVQFYLDYAQGFPMVKGTENLIQIYAVKYGPINYKNPPNFVYPLTIQTGLTKEPIITIDHSNKGGPFKNWNQLITRIRGK